MTTQTQNDRVPSTPSDAGSPNPTSVKDAAAGVADEAGRTIEKRAAVGMSQVGATLHEVARAVRDSSETLQSEQPQIGRFVATAADKLDEVGTYVQDREPAELLDGAQSFARRQPAVVIVGGLVAGLLVGRMLRAAGSQTQGTGGTSADWYGAGYEGSGTAPRSGSGTGASNRYGTGYGASYDATDGNGSSAGMPSFGTTPSGESEG